MSDRKLPAAPRLGEQLCHALYSASSALTQAYRPLLEPLGLTYPQFIVMMALWEEDDVPVSTLARKVRLGKSTMTPLLRRLEGKNLLERRIDADDERQLRIRLTASGSDLATAGSQAADQAFCATGFEPREALELQQRCLRLVENLERD